MQRACEVLYYHLWPVWLYHISAPISYMILSKKNFEHRMSIFIFCTNVNRNPTDARVCRYLFTAKLLYMFRVSQHPSSGVLKTVPSASGTGHTTTATPLRRGLIGTQSRSDHVSDINTSIIRNLRLFC